MSPGMKVWKCPKCQRTFREHVFGEGTYGSGPICNVCCAHLVLIGEEPRERPVPASAGEGWDPWGPYATRETTYRSPF